MIEGALKARDLTAAQRRLLDIETYDGTALGRLVFHLYEAA